VSVALVTGASGGLGGAIAGHLSREGHHVVAVGRDQAALSALAARVEDVVVYVADLTDQAAVDGLLADWPDVEVLVCAAGGACVGPVRRAGWPAIERTLLLNANATLRLCAHHAPRMAARGRGAILTVASTAAFGAAPDFAAYGAAKACVLSFSRSLAAELSGTGVVVRCVAPGPMATGFRAATGLGPRSGEADPDAVARYALALLSGRRVWGLPRLVDRARRWAREVTPAVAWRWAGRA